VNWTVTTGKITRVVEAASQHEAYDALRHEDRYAFGLVVSACPTDRDGDPDAAFPIRTSALMGRWGRIHDAREFIERAKTKGLGDTTAQDIPT